MEQQRRTCLPELQPWVERWCVCVQLISDAAGLPAVWAFYALQGQKTGGTTNVLRDVNGVHVGGGRTRASARVSMVGDDHKDTLENSPRA